MKKVLVIQPKKNNEQFITDEQWNYIQKVLEESCQGAVCISRERLFEELKGPLKLLMEQYQFEQAITQGIRNKRITGFETRSGRNGGICRAGAFKKQDEARKIKKRTRKKRFCTVTVGEKTFHVPIYESQALAFLSVLKANPANNGKGNIYINDSAYDIPSTIGTADVLEKFLTELCKARETD